MKVQKSSGTENKYITETINKAKSCTLKSQKIDKYLVR